MIVAGVDVGGTNIEVGLVDDDHKVVARTKQNTPHEGPDAVLDVIAELIGKLGHEPAAVGVGIPGVVHDGDVLTVPNLVNWTKKVDIGGGLTKRVGVPVTLGNDANVGLLGEWTAGAARGQDNVLGVWMGTGVGGALILNGRPFDGARGAAGELGHVIVRADGALCGCGRRGCLEAYAGRRSMATIAAALVAAGRKTKLFDIAKDEGKATITSRVWARALEEKDELAEELIETAVQTLGIGVASSVNLLDVELVVLGGGLAQKLGQPLADRIGAAAAPWMLRPSPKLEWITAKLGDNAGVVGAATLARASVIAA